MNPRKFKDARDTAPDADRGEASRTQGLIGTVRHIDHAKRFGFLVADGKDYFFHASAFTRAEDFDQLQVGTTVTFEPSRGPKGLRAESLALITL